VPGVPAALASQLPPAISIPGGDDAEDEGVIYKPLRAKDVAWNGVARRFGCNRVTAWRRWQRALRTVVDKLGDVSPSVRDSCQILPNALP